MDIFPNQPSLAEEEAAEWFTKIKAASASSDELLEFYAWRKHPENAAAYRSIDRFWFSSAPLAEDPEIAQLLREARAREPSQRAKGIASIWPLAGGAMAIAASIVFALLVIGPGFGEVGYQTAVGEQRLVTLGDGSRIKLDTNSRILVRFTARARSIDLRRGQAFFDVAHSTIRPLTVIAGQTVVHDLGTRFDMRREAQAVQITLLEGSVQVTGQNVKSKAWILAAGEQMTTGSAPNTPHPVDSARVAGWTTGQLVFDSTPLSEAVEEMNRYTLHKLELDAGSTGALRVSGAFDPRKTSEFVKAVTRLYPLQAHATANGDVVLRSAALNRGL